MSISLRPRPIVATLLVFLLVGSLPTSAASAEVDSTRPAATVGSAQADVPWWVEWLQAFDLNGNRIDDEAEAVAERSIEAGKPDALVPVLVSFARSPINVDRLIGLVGAASDAYVFKTQPLVDLNVPARNLARLETVPGVVAVEYDRTLYPVLDVGARAIQAHNGSDPNTFYNGQTAEDLGYTGEDMLVAVLDTGVQDQHSAFDGKWIAGANVSTVVPLHCVNTPDDDGHGTHVASTVLGQMPGDDLFGTAKAAKLVEVKISVGPASLGGINRGFEFVRLYNDALEAGDPLCGPDDDHIDVATLSFGSTGRGGPSAGSTEGFIDALVNSGVAVTIAVGNCGPQASATCNFSDDDNGISSPGNAAGAIGVASFNDRNTVDRANDVISGFSSRGPNSGGGDTAAGGATDASNLKDRYRKPDVAAPGQSIQAAGPLPFTLSTSSGTSMAAPHVAGVAALLLQAGEGVKDETGGVNLMASTGNGFTSDNDYSFGEYPVRDALAHATDYKEAGAKALWTGPNSGGVQWNNAWGYGQTNAFDALCWAWANVLAPGGATTPAPVDQNCDLTTDPDPDPTPTESPTPEPTECPESPSTSASTRYFFHSASGIGNIDGFDDSTTFDTEFPTFDAPAEFFDVSPLANSAPNQPWDPFWIGSVSERIDELEVDFWARVPVGRTFGQLDYDVSVWVGDAQHQLPTFTIEVPPALSNGYLQVVHRFDEKNAANVLPIDPAGKQVTIVIGHHFSDFGAGSSIRYDSKTMPAGFTATTVSGDGAGSCLTSVSFTEDSATSGQFTDQTFIEAQLQDAQDLSIEGAELVFELAGAESSRTFDATTDGNGIASVTPTLDEEPGSYELIVTYAGDDDHQGSSDRISFVVDKEDTNTEMTVEGRGRNRVIEARLSDLDTPADGIGGRTFDFYADGELIGSATTDDDGVAILEPPPRYRGGPHTFEARFEGDDFYVASGDQQDSDTGPPGGTSIPS